MLYNRGIWTVFGQGEYVVGVVRSVWCVVVYLFNGGVNGVLQRATDRRVAKSHRGDGETAKAIDC
jgi:hypothetical protein